VAFLFGARLVLISRGLEAVAVGIGTSELSHQ
jgi:hypothetical protein